MPVGFDKVEEAELDKADFLPPVDQQSLTHWWLAERRSNSQTPNWDIASTCTIDGRQGLVLVEAKAHGTEFTDGGKPLRDGDARRIMSELDRRSTMRMRALLKLLASIGDSQEVKAIS
jgi:hypothetical protein